MGCLIVGCIVTTYPKLFRDNMPHQHVHSAITVEMFSRRFCIYEGFKVTDFVSMQKIACSNISCVTVSPGVDDTVLNEQKKCYFLVVEFEVN